MKKNQWKLIMGIIGAFLFLLQALNLPAAEISEQNRFIHPEYSKTISMDFKEAALSDVLKIFSQQSGMNFIASTDLANKKVTLFFENVPVEEALQRILSTTIDNIRGFGKGKPLNAVR